jgi:branched-chain amino acid transport system permease protein
MTAFLQVLGTGLLMGLIYALIAVGLSLIFGLMDVVNFAHGEFLMLAMYATFGFAVFAHLDPVIALPLVAAVMFILGAVVYAGVVRHAMRSKVNAGMVQIFSTFGLATLIQGAAQFFFTPDFRNVDHTWLSTRTLDLGGIFLPWSQVFGGVVSLVAFGGLFLMMKHTDFGRALEATREDKGAVALVGIDSNRVFALGWGLGRHSSAWRERCWPPPTPSTRKWARVSQRWPTSRSHSAGSAACSGRSRPASSSDSSRPSPPTCCRLP